MGSENYPLRNIGIYRNLPTFDPSITNLSAIVTGANGISGFYLMSALLDSPQRWTKIYALSRRPPPAKMMGLLTPDQRSRVQHVACDFLSDPDTIAQALLDANVQASHVFFYSYLQPRPPAGQPLWSNADELVRVNTALLSNFLAALPKAHVHPRRFVLQTGAKNYGVHIGRIRQPAIESDPQPAHLEPNFYYPQEAALFAYCRDTSGPPTAWNVVMPMWIIGAVTNAAMNALHPFAVYAAVQARKNEPIAFPGDWAGWQRNCNFSTARLTGYLTEWIALEDKCANARFNASDTSPLSFDRFYEHLARWYGVSAGVVPPPLPEDASRYATIVGRAGADTPLGYGPPVIHRASFSFVQWAQDPANKKVWEEIMAESAKAIGTGTGGDDDDDATQLTHNPFDEPVDHFSCGDAAWLDMVMSMDRARKLGWSGYVDSTDSVWEMYRDMVALGMLPPMVVDRPGLGDE